MELFYFLPPVVLVKSCYLNVILQFLALDEPVIKRLEVLEHPFLLEYDLADTDQKEKDHLTHQKQHIYGAAARPGCTVDLRNTADVTNREGANKQDIAGYPEDEVSYFGEANQHDEVYGVNGLEDDEDDT